MSPKSGENLLSSENDSRLPLQVELVRPSTLEDAINARRLNSLLKIVKIAKDVSRGIEHVEEPEQIVNLDGSDSATYTRITTDLSFLERLRDHTEGYIQSNEGPQRLGQNESGELIMPQEIDKTGAEIVKIENPTELLFLLQYFELFHHDLAGPITTLIGYIQMARRQINKGADPATYIGMYHSELSALTKLLDIPYKLTRDRSSQDILSTKEEQAENSLVSVIEKNFRGPLLAKNPPIHPQINIPPELFEKYKAVWSYLWIGVTYKNIVQNTDRAYRALVEMFEKHGEAFTRTRTATFEAGEATEEDIKKLKEDEKYRDYVKGDHYIKFVTEDRATGFQDDKNGYNIARDGYAPGKTSYGDTEVSKEGKGTAMTLISDISYERYGVIIVPENVTDDHGNIIGARHTIFIPAEPVAS